MLWPHCLTQTYFIMTHYYTVWSFSSSSASGFRSRALLYIICNGGPGLQSFFFLLLHKLLLSPELLVFSPLLPPSALSIGRSWSKHYVLHIILLQSPPAVISLGSRCSSWANCLIHLTGECLTGYVLAKLMSSHFYSIYNSWSKHFFFSPLALHPMWMSWRQAPELTLQIIRVYL